MSPLSIAVISQIALVLCFAAVPFARVAADIGTEIFDPKDLVSAIALTIFLIFSLANFMAFMEFTHNSRPVPALLICLFCLFELGGVLIRRLKWLAQ